MNPKTKKFIKENLITKKDKDLSEIYLSKIDKSYLGCKIDTATLNELVKRGITDQLISGLGFNLKEKKWYGWSHRAICGFVIGDKIFEEKFGTDNTPYTKHGKVTIKTLAQAKKSAQNFARYVA